MSHHHHHPHHTQPTPSKKPLHRGWVFTAAGILMLIAILVYVLTLNESDVPGQPVIPPVTAPVNP